MADDSTFTFSTSDPVEMSEKLTKVYKEISDYMGNNRLVINDDKTHLIVMGTRKNKEKRGMVQFTAGNSTITPTPSEKLLGLNINENMKFHDHILTNEKSLLRNLTSRMNAVSRVSKYSSFKTRLMIANAVFNSVPIYMISVWGGSEKFVIRALQVMQNKVARCVTRLGWFTPTKQLLLQCNWLSVRQLATYHTALQVYKARRDHKPEYIDRIFSRPFPYNTRAAAGDNIRILQDADYSFSSQSFMVRGSKIWNSLPAELRMINKVDKFKKGLRQWIRDRVELE